MRQSMTGFASQTGNGFGHGWVWDLRSVNNRGLDMRLRLPDGLDGLEQPVRKAVAGAVARGSVHVGLRLQAEAGGEAFAIDGAALDAAILAIRRAEAQAAQAGLALAPTSAAQILTLRGVLGGAAPMADPDGLRAAVLADFDLALAAFVENRRAEGAALHAVIAAQIDEIAELVARADKAAAARADAQRDRLRAQLARVMDNTDAADPDRVAQELALIAVRADVTEELDRLRAHVAAARALLDDPKPVGRRLDFLCQEFNREANTLCSKSGDQALTAQGLALKTVIEQMREQIQNME